MPARYVAWPSNLADGEVKEIHKPWFEPALPLGVPESAQMFLDCLLESYDAGVIDLPTALIGEALLLIHGWEEIDSHIDSSPRLHKFWTNVFQMTRSPPL